MPVSSYPHQAIAQASNLALQPALWERPQVEGFTIDGPTSQDLDDAIWIEPTQSGAVLSIHVADVAELITPGTLLDKQAIARTQTRYFGKGNEPMLPRVLSEDKLSLHQGEARPTITVKVTLNQLAQITQTEIFESWLVSVKRFSYVGCDRACQDATDKYHSVLKRCREWAERLSKQRQQEGAFGGLYSKAGYFIDENGNIIFSKSHYHAQVIIQEFMILANHAVAQWMAERDLVALYRNHTARLIAPERGEMIQSLLMTGNPQLLRQQLMHWLNRAEYGPTLIGHFALNLTAYCHFTSPIRRLADLINHRIVKAQLRSEKHPYSKLDLEQLAKHIYDVTLEFEQESAEHHKQQRKDHYQSLLEQPDSLEHLAEKDFGRVLKHAIKAEDIEPIRTDTLNRLEQAKLTIQDLYLLLFRSREAELRQRVCKYLEGHPGEAMSILAIALDQMEDWERLDFNELDEKSPFITWLEILIEGKSLTTKYPAEHQRKQNARHQACLSWIQAYVLEELVSPQERVRPVRSAPEQEEQKMADAAQGQPEPRAINPILEKPLNDEQNFVGLLNQLCQAMEWDYPEFEFSEQESEFSCFCSIEVAANRVTGTGSATKKQQSKQLAARDVLEQLLAMKRGNL